MVVGQPIFQENDTADQHAIVLRQLLGHIYGNFAGVMGVGHLSVAERAAGANMSVDVAAGAGLPVGSAVTNQGLYYDFNDGVLNVTITAADPSNPRHDLVILQVRDAFYSGTDNDGRIIAVAGTPAASPADPDLVALGYTNYLTLARVVVGAGVTSIVNANITNFPLLTTPVGTILRRNSIQRPSSPWTGLIIFETDTNRFMFWDGSAWRYLPWGSGTNPNKCELKRESSQTITASAETQLDFDTAVYDPSGMANLTNNTITVNRTGRWKVYGRGWLAAPSSTSQIKPIVKIGGLEPSYGARGPNMLTADSPSGNFDFDAGSLDLPLTNGDVLSFWAHLTIFGGNQSVTKAVFGAEFICP